MVTPDGTTAYVVLTGTASIVPINLATGAPGTGIRISGVPDAIAVTPDGTTVYVTDLNSNTVLPIDVTTNTTGTPIPVDNTPHRIAITPDGKTAYIVNTGNNTVTLNRRGDQYSRYSNPRRDQSTGGRGCPPMVKPSMSATTAVTP